MQKYCILFISTLCSLIFTINCAIHVCMPLKEILYEEEQYSDEQLYQEMENDIRDTLIKKDKIYIGHLDLDIRHPAFRVNGTLDNLMLSNLNDSSLRLFILHWTGMDLFNLTFNNLTITGQYDWDGNIGDLFDIYGNGPFWIVMSDFSIAMTHFKFSISNEMCVNINIEINLGQEHNHFENFFNGDSELEPLMNELFEAILPESLKIIWGELKEQYDAALEKLINDWLHKKHIRKLLQRKLLSSYDRELLGIK